MLAEGKTRELPKAIREGSEYFGTMTFNQALANLIRTGEISMDDGAVVRGGQRRGDLPSDADRLVDLEGPRLQHHRQILTRDQLHGDEGDVRLVDAADRGDVWMVQRGQQFRFAF